MGKTCICNDTTNIDTEKPCSECTSLCKTKGVFVCVNHDNPSNSTLWGLNVKSFAIITSICIVLFGFTLWYTTHVLQKCKMKKWMPAVVTTIITICVLVWYPPIAVTVYLLLLVLLTIYNFRC